MSMQEMLFNTLKDLVNNRVYPLLMPEKATFPCIIYQRVSTFDTQTIEGTQSLDLARVQVTIFAKSYPQSVALCEEVKTAMSGKALQLMHIEDYENDTQLFSQKLDYQLSF